jgi:hypothetical protein
MLPRITGETAVAAGRTATREGACYRRLARRRGKLKAQVAVGNTQLKVYHALLSRPGTRYQDLGPDYYERRASTRRQTDCHVGKLAALGFEVTLCRIPEPEVAGIEPGLHTQQPVVVTAVIGVSPVLEVWVGEVRVHPPGSRWMHERP